MSYYDREGKPLTREEFCNLYERSLEYRVVKQETLPNGKYVSTVWLGLNHNYGNGAPLIFETMVFPSQGNFSDLDMERYSTEMAAQIGHTAMVEKWSAT